MNHRRVFGKIFNKFFLNVNKSKRNISFQERYAIIIVNSLVNTKDTEIKISPRICEFYVKNEKNKIFVCFEEANKKITIINHIYSYIVELNEYSTNRISNIITQENEKRMNILKREYMFNIRHSLRTVAEFVIDNRKK